VNNQAKRLKNLNDSSVFGKKEAKKGNDM